METTPKVAYKQNKSAQHITENSLKIQTFFSKHGLLGHKNLNERPLQY